MEVQIEDPSGEIKHLRHCINDLISVLGLPVIWSGSEPFQIIRSLLDTLLSMLRLDFVYVRVKEPIGDAPTEMVRVAQSREQVRSQEICELVNHWLGDDHLKSPRLVRNPLGDDELSIVAVPFGLQGEIGIIVVGAQRRDFPRQTERLVLSMAANLAVLGLQEARLRSEQKGVASELDRRVAQRTRELGHANVELRKEIAERQRVEAQLRRSEAFLAEAQQLSRTGSFCWRVATDEITWSEQLYNTFEFELGTPVTIERIISRVHPGDVPMMNERVESARTCGEDFEYPHRLLMPDGSVKYLIAIAHASLDAEGRLEYIGAVQDVTQRRLSEEALAKAQSELARVARVTSLGVFTASIAHEVNQPLSGIITNASTCLRMLTADSPNLDGARETARRTIRDGNRASEVIARLRALFSKKDITIEALDLNEAVREVIALSLSELQRHRVILRPELADDLPLVTGDRVQLQQVILNLLWNASDAMNTVDDRPRDLLIRTEREEGNWARFSVKDAGLGFDPQHMNKLFEAFYTTKNEGMGIGLSVSRSIIESHQGRLWAAQNDGPGATFSFSIPCRPDTKVQ